jgi:hypothetical protein
MAEQGEQTSPDGEQEPEGMDPTAWAKRMQIEFAAARIEVQQWHSDSRDILRRFRDERQSPEARFTRWNAYPMNIQTQRALIYGQVPSADVTRRNADADDDIARVAANILERNLNLDMSRAGDGYVDGLAYALDDRMQVGLGNARERYIAEFQTVPEEPAMMVGDMEAAPAVPEHEEKVDEDIVTDYLHWADQLWSAGARTENEKRWVAFRSALTRKQIVARFSESLARLCSREGEPANGVALARSVPLNHKKDKMRQEVRAQDPWPKADVWEVWHKEYRCVLWWVEGFPYILDYQDDPLGLEGFFPCPRPMCANLTTSTTIPRPDFMLAKDQYNLLDRITARKTLLIDALRVAGCYNKTAGDLQRLVKETSQNQLIPVDNWAMFAEKGGIKGQIDLFPIDLIASVLQQLTAEQENVLSSLYQITGFSDILRGEALESGVTATEQRAKTRFASVRMRWLQDEFARFATDLLKIKAEIICKHYDAKTIIERSNIMFTPDAQYAEQAVQLLKSDHSQWRVEVKPESVNLTDFAALKQQKTEYIQSLAGFITSALPLVQMLPTAGPYLLEMLKWYMAGQPDSAGVESILDRAIASAEQMQQSGQPAQPQQPSAEQLKLLIQQQKSQQDLLKTQADLRAKLIEKQADVASKDAQEKSQAHWNIVEAQGKRTGIDPTAGAPIGGFSGVS